MSHRDDMFVETNISAQHISPIGTAQIFANKIVTPLRGFTYKHNLLEFYKTQVPNGTKYKKCLFLHNYLDSFII
jgi:hypothetical protein